MARIDVLPSVEIIRGFKGILDFYLWRGLPCVRAWPRYRPAKQSAASLAAALTFGAIVKAYSRMGEIALQAYRNDASDQPRTARDIYVTSQYGHLHEATMSDFLDAIIIIRDSVVALTDLLNALDSISTDEIDVNVEHSVLPLGASTLAEQQTQTAALVKIDDLQDALESIALDRLLVRGMDQLFSLKEALIFDGRIINAAAGNNTIVAGPVPANQYWIPTRVWAVDETTGITRIELRLVYNGTTTRIDAHLPTAPFDGASLPTPLVLWPTSNLHAFFVGCVLNDFLRLSLNGYIMTLET